MIVVKSYGVGYVLFIVLTPFFKSHLKCLDHFHPSLVSTRHQELSFYLAIFPSRQWKPVSRTGELYDVSPTLPWPVSMRSCGSVVPKEFLSTVSWFYIFQKEKASFCCLFPNPPFTQYLTQYLFQGNLMVMMLPTPSPYQPQTPSLFHCHCRKVGKQIDFQQFYFFIEV